MRDPRNAKLAELLVHHSTRLKPGDTCFVEAFDVADGLVLDLVEAIHAAGAIPIVSLRNVAVTRAMMLGASERQFELQAEVELAQMKQSTAYIGLRGSDNTSELSDRNASGPAIAIAITAATGQPTKSSDDSGGPMNLIYRHEGVLKV